MTRYNTRVMMLILTLNKVDTTKIRNTISNLTQISRLYVYGTQMCIVVDNIVVSVAEPTPSIDQDVDHCLL